MQLEVDENIRIAKTLPAEFYRSEKVFNLLIEHLFTNSWQFIGSDDLLPHSSYAHPFMLLEDGLNEPLLLVRDQSDELYCLSNICTHRGMFLIDRPGPYRLLSCKYHGRCFEFNGKFRSMPAFEQTENFPSETDDLLNLPLHSLGNMLFTRLQGVLSFDRVFKPIQERMYWYDYENLVYCPEHGHSYDVKTHWALYCDNYLEGFHVPFIHPGLNASLDAKAYDTELFEYCNLQVGIASAKGDRFELPADAQDHGKDIYAYYWWVFPNLMINYYTWGISVNVVEPIDMDRTRVRFHTFLFKDERAKAFSKKDLHDTELEDEEVVEKVNIGLKSRLYRHGRFSPTKEQGVHHFQRLLSIFMEQYK